MATREQIISFLDSVKDIRPETVTKSLNETMAGIGAVLRILNVPGKRMTAGEISRELGVSTARVAVILKKMEAKGILVRETGIEDARTTVVHLTDNGMETACKVRDELFADVGRAIDTIGEERLLEFVNTFRELREVLKGPVQDV